MRAVPKGSTAAAPRRRLRATRPRRSRPARGARRLAARPAPDLRELRRRPLERAGACRRRAGRRGAAAMPCSTTRSTSMPASASARRICCRRSAWAGNRRGERKVLYLTADRFMYGFVAALKTQTALAFKERLRGIDLLVIDDVQFIQGKSIQEEFGHTLNALIDAGRQVVVAADRPPTELESLDERVRSRLAGGLVVEIGALDEELRARDPQVARRCGPRPIRRLRRARPRARPIVARADHRQRPRPRRRRQPAARPCDADRPAGDAGDGRARSATSSGPRARSGSRSRTSRSSSPALQRQPRPTSCPSAAPPPW